MKYLILTIQLLLIISSSITYTKQTSSLKTNIIELKSHITQEERESYEKWLSFKNSFVRDDYLLKNLPKSFQLEKEEYYLGLLKFGNIFFLLSGLIGGIVALYIILRFGCKKCVGPNSIKQINKNYKVVTTVLIAISVICLMSVWIIILVPSVKLTSGGYYSTNQMQHWNSVNYNHLPHLKALKDSINKNEKIPVEYYFSEDNYNSLESGITNNHLSLDQHIGSFKKGEIGRTVANVLLFAFHALLLIIAIVAYYKNSENWLLAVSVMFLITLPIILLIEAVNSGYFFVVSDLCDSVNSAIYKNKIPIHNKGYGYLVSCNDNGTKTAAFTYNYEMTEVYNYMVKLKEDINVSSEDLALADSVILDIKEVKEKYVDSILNCFPLYSSLEVTEKEFCVYASGSSYHIFQNYFWLFLSVIITTWSFSRLSLIAKRKLIEVKEKLINEESDY